MRVLEALICVREAISSFPAVISWVSGGDQQLPGGDQLPSGDDQLASGGDQQLPGGDQLVSGGDQQLPGGDQLPSGGDQQLPGGDQLVSLADQLVPAARTSPSKTKNPNLLHKTWDLRPLSARERRGSDGAVARP